MEIPNYTPIPTSLNIPKMSSEEIEMKNGYYIVTDGVSFNYYAIKPHPYKDDDTDPSPLIRFAKAPPVIMEGWVVLSKKLYRVTVQDLQRGLIRKSRRVQLGNIYGIDSSTSNDTTTTSTTGGTEGNENRETNVSEVRISSEAGRIVGTSPDESSALEVTSLEEHEAVDSAFNEQVRSLLDFMHTKEGEEWEVEIPQKS